MYRTFEWLLGFPAFATVAALLWWQWKQVHLLALQFLLAADRLLALPPLPPLAVYALLGAIGAFSLTLLKQDQKLITGPLCWRALLIPLLLAALVWWMKK
ncbi:MAG: hypothetical protein ACAI44_39205 [Candidatus Sericytochromatia bacterium]